MADSETLHDGHLTLERMEHATQYNAWIGRKMREHLGARVLEVGAGLGTITEQLHPGRELVIALDMEALYVEKLRRRFKSTPNVRPHLSGVERADWQALASERLDSIVLSNVLEHIADDAEAVRNFRLALKPGGNLVLWVPALPALFGSLDEAVGHHRRYTPKSLRKVLTENGFTIEALEWMNLVGIPGWFLNSRVLRKRSLPPLQLKLYDAVAPAIAQLESRVRLPVGLSLFCVARWSDL